MRESLMFPWFKSGLHNSESSKGKMININLLRAAKVSFIVLWKKFWNDSYLFEVKLLQHFLQMRKLLWVAKISSAGHMLCRPGLNHL